MTNNENIVPKKVVELIKRIFSKEDKIMSFGLDYEILEKLFIKKMPIIQIIEESLKKVKKLGLGE